MDINEIRAKTAVVGLAETGCGLAPGWNAMELMATAVYDALDDAGLSIQEVDGLFAATAFHSMAAMSLSEYLGIRPKFADGSNIGGSSFLAHILTAAMALDAGLINVAVIAYGSNQRSAGGFKTISEAISSCFLPGNIKNLQVHQAHTKTYQINEPHRTV